MANTVKDLLKGFKGLLDKTDADENIVKGFNAAKANLGAMGSNLNAGFQNWQAKPSNTLFSNPQQGMKNIQQTANTIMGGSVAQAGRMAMPNLNGPMKNIVEAVTRAPGAISNAVSFGAVDPLRNMPAQTSGGKVGELAGSMYGFGASPLTKGLLRFTNPIANKAVVKIAPKLAPLAGSIAPRVASAVANVGQGLAFNATQRQLPNPAGVVLDAATGFAMGPKQFKTGPVAKGMVFGRTTKTTWHPEDVDLLDQVADTLNQVKKFTPTQLNTIDTWVTNLAKGYLKNDTIDSIASKNGGDQVKFMKAVVGELQKSAQGKSSLGARFPEGMVMGIKGDAQVKVGGRIPIENGRIKLKSVSPVDTRNGRMNMNSDPMTMNQGIISNSKGAASEYPYQTTSTPQLKTPKSIKQQLDATINPLQEISLNGSIPSTRERGFVTSVQEAPKVTDPTKVDVAGTYTVKSNIKLMGEAEALLQEGAAIDFKNTKNLDQKVAATIQQAINLDKSGDHDAAAALYNNLAEHATELGRGVQAFSLLERMSPEAISLSAAGKIRKYNASHSAKIPELTGDQQKLIADQVNAIRQMPDGREKNIAVNELGNTINGFIPSSFGDKAISVWKAGLLTSLRTHERNFVGNTIHTTAEVAKDLVASPVDQLMSLKTGKRTVTATVRGMGEFGSKNTQQQMTDIFSKGYDPSEQINKFDHRQINWGDNPLEQFLKKYTNVVFRSLGASDKPFYNAAFARSLYDQAGAEAINAGKRGDTSFIESLIQTPTEEMLKNAVSDANVATFKNKNVASTVATAIKRELGKNEIAKVAGEVVLPFTGVPSSILGQAQAYSPIGLTKGIAKVGQVMAGQVPELQRQAAQEVGRGVVGTGVMGLGAYLAGKGLITGQPNDAAEARQWELENKPRNSIKWVDGTWKSLNSIGPESIVFLAGAKLNEEMGKPDGSLAKYGLSLAKDQIDQSFLTGLQAPVNAITDPARYSKSYVGNTLSSVIPNIGKDAAKSLDPYQREMNTVADYSKAGIPGLRNTLVTKRNALGEVMKQEPTGINAFIDLFNTKTPNESAVITELSRLNEVGNNSTPSKLTASQTILKEKVKLTMQQLDQLEAGSGELVKQSLEKLIASPSYIALDDEQKASAIDKIVQQSRAVYKAQNGADILNNTANSNDIIPKAQAKESPSQGLKAKFDKPFVVASDTGSVDIIDLSKDISLPTATKDAALNKKLLSQYQSKLTARQNQIIKVMEDGQISQDDAIKLWNEVEILKKKSGSGGKSLSISETKMPSVKASTPSRISLVKFSNGSTGLKLLAPRQTGSRMGQNVKIKLLKKPTIKIAKSYYKGAL